MAFLPKQLLESKHDRKWALEAKRMARLKPPTAIITISLTCSTDMDTVTKQSLSRRLDLQGTWMSGVMAESRV